MTSSNPEQKPVSNTHFLIELRARLMRSTILLLSLFAFFIFFSNNLYSWLAAPLVKFLPQGHLIATQIVAPVFVPFKLAFVVAVFLAVPYFIYQVWGFVAPALYNQERRVIWPFILLTTILFYAGLAFAYWVIFPLLFHFLATIAPKEVILTPDISEYLDFTIKLLLVFGALFEIPIIMLLLVMINWVPRASFIKWRSYALVGAFVLGMLLAPPDVFSQTILAIPIWCLYELGIFLTRFIKHKNNENIH